MYNVIANTFQSVFFLKLIDLSLFDRSLGIWSSSDCDLKLQVGIGMLTLYTVLLNSTKIVPVLTPWPVHFPCFNGQD